MSKKEVLRGAVLKDYLELDMDDLERSLTLVASAIATKAKQSVRTYQAKMRDLEEERRKMLEMEPTIKEIFASKPVKLNVGGTIFSTMLEHLLREPKTFFSTMFGGRWEVKYDPLDGSVFIDRDPTMFQLILNYMREGIIDLDDLTSVQRSKLEREADFYPISSLIRLLNPQSFR